MAQDKNPRKHVYFKYRNPKMLQLLIYDRFIRDKNSENSIQEILSANAK